MQAALFSQIFQYENTFIHLFMYIKLRDTDACINEL